MKNLELLLKLALKFFLIGLLSFGGGMASIAILFEIIVKEEAWLTTEAFTDLLTLSQMTPGPIAINAATFVGTHLAGFSGAVVSTLASVLAPFICVLLLAWLYKKYQHLEGLQKSLKGLRICSLFLLFQASILIFQNSLEGLGQSLEELIFLSGLFCLLMFLKVRYKWSILPLFAFSGLLFLSFKLLFSMG